MRRALFILGLLATLPLGATAQDTVPLPYYEDWDSWFETNNSHVAGWWFCKESATNISIIQRTNLHGLMLTGSDSSETTLALPYFENLPDTFSIYLYGSHLTGHLAAVEIGFIPDGSVITDPSDACALFQPYDTAYLSIVNVWERTTLAMQPYYDQFGASHRFALRLRNNYYQRVYVDEIHAWRKHFYDTVVYRDTICQHTSYSGHGFTVGSDTTAVAGELELWHSVTIGDTTHHNQLLLTVMPETEGDTLLHIIVGDTLFFHGDTLTQAGTYLYHFVTAYGCDSLLTLHLAYEEVGLTASDPGLCPGDSVTLTASGTHYVYWSAIPPDAGLDAQQGQTSVTVTPRHTTTYGLCPYADGEALATITVEVDVAPEPCVQLSRSFIDHDDPVVIFTDCSEGSAHSTWSFSDGAVIEKASARRQFHHPLPDSVEVTLQSCNRWNCCTDTTFSVPSLIRSVWFPNVFTPGEESNNRFGITASFEIKEFELYIYNRQGLLIYHTDDPAALWDGTLGGRPCPQGAYVYHWHVRDAVDYYKSGTGTITLLR